MRTSITACSVMDVTVVSRMTVVVTGDVPTWHSQVFAITILPRNVEIVCTSLLREPLSQQAGKSEENYDRTFAYHLVLSRLVIFRQDGIGVGFMAAVGKSYLVFDELLKHPLTREGGCPDSAQISDNASAGIARYRL